MIYPFKKSRSRFVSLILVLTLLAGVLAGCQKDKPEDTNPTGDAVTPPGFVEVKETDPPETTEATEPKSQNMAVAKEQLTIRSTPSTTSTPIGYLDKGTEVEILRKETVQDIEWALIREGWIAMEYLEMTDGTTAKDPNTSTPAGNENPDETKPEENKNTNKDTATKGVITASPSLYIRESANNTADIVGTYAKNDVVTILETKNGWGRTNKGWISMKYVNTSGDTSKDDGKDNNKDTDKNTGTADGATYFITGNELNIRSSASLNGDIQGQYKRGDAVKVLETKNGWGRTDKGWISMDYAYKTGTTGKNTAKGIVTATPTLNVRSGPGTGYNGVGSVKYGDRVNILERITIGNTTWGCISTGWISLDHVYIDGTKGDGAGKGTITGNGVNIRSGPGTGYQVVGSMNEGDAVEILAQFKVGDMTWGCTSKGWISMSYVGVG